MLSCCRDVSAQEKLQKTGYPYGINFKLRFKYGFYILHFIPLCINGNLTKIFYLTHLCVLVNSNFYTNQKKLLGHLKTILRFGVFRTLKSQS